MRTIYTRPMLMAAVIFAAFAASAAAQAQASPILNKLEVQKLATSSEPKDNARLAAHFTALADQYTAEARRHTSMAQTYSGNRNLGPSMSVHCAKIGELNTQTATTLRELATHHQKVAAGEASMPPSGAAAFQGGRGARDPSETELRALAARASSVSDHRALEEYFLTLAKRYTSEANQHTALAQASRGSRITWASGIHDHLADLARKSANEATASATMHKDMAGLGR